MTKKILITGKNSYVGNHVADWLNKEPEKYEVIKVSVRDDKWKEINFSLFDVIVHVAGMAHVKETKENKKNYYKVNRDLTYEIAKKAKADGVNQFIFLSSMSVYGLEIGAIDKSTPLRPNTTYGKSKVEAEKLIKSLSDEFFKVVIIRPPMIYGKSCKGNYPKLANMTLKMPIFPKVNNKRSMIYIDNLSEFIRQLIDNCDVGLFFPQNEEYVNTSEMVKLIAEAHKKRMKLTRVFSLLLKLSKVSILNKIFGNLVYEKSMSEYSNNYIVCDFKKSIFQTEGVLE